MSKDIAVVAAPAGDDGRKQTIGGLVAQLNQFKELYAKVMVKGLDYGLIPGTGSKPSLLQPGAQKIALLAQWATEYIIQRLDLETGHREYIITCTLRDPEGRAVGQGVGSCSTVEKKYRRNDPADVYNTVLKMAKKRAYVDAVITASGVGMMFTQDVEDLDFGPGEESKPAPKQQKTIGERTADLKKLIESQPVEVRESIIMAFSVEKGVDVMDVHSLSEEVLAWARSNWKTWTETK